MFQKPHLKVWIGFAKRLNNASCKDGRTLTEMS